MNGRTIALVTVGLSIFAAGATNGLIIVSATGNTAPDIAASVDAFRNDLGTLNPNVAGSFGSGRREINWDGVPDALSAPNNLPADFFNVNSPRGAVFSTPGTGFQVSANAGIAPIQFDNINPTYSATFETFSPQRLFTSLGNNTLDINFFIPGSDKPALTQGFGAVFSDVDLANTTSITLFGSANNSLGTFFVPATAGSETFSFLGILFPDPVISRVRITSGNVPVGGIDQNGDFADVVVMDDFIYSEPRGVPDTGMSVTLLAIAFSVLEIARRKLHLASPIGSPQM
jgi:hypothetical protein